MLDSHHQDVLVAEYKQIIYDEGMRKYSYDCDYYEMRQAPHLMYSAIVKKDGDMYCCLYGENLQEGIAGFGKTPHEACAAFDKTWRGGEAETVINKNV